jgi:hypothetical protein
MPTTATITAFYSFSPGVKALSSEVNTNFANLKGHFLPIDPTSSSASNANYDLGSDDHRWLTTYIKDIDIVSSTSTASLSISGDTSLTFGAFKFNIEGSEKFRITSDGFSGINVSPTSYTSTALKNQFARSSGFNITTAYPAVTLIDGSTITISTSGRPVKFGITTPYSGGREDSAQFVGLVNTVTANLFGIQYNVHPNTLGIYYFNTGVYRWAYYSAAVTGTANQLDQRRINNIFNGVLLLPAGTHTLCLSFQTANILSCFYYGNFYAYEV